MHMPAGCVQLCGGRRRTRALTGSDTKTGACSSRSSSPTSERRRLNTSVKQTRRRYAQPPRRADVKDAVSLSRRRFLQNKLPLGVRRCGSRGESPLAKNTATTGQQKHEQLGDNTERSTSERRLKKPLVAAAASAGPPQGLWTLRRSLLRPPSPGIPHLPLHHATDEAFRVTFPQVSFRDM